MFLTIFAEILPKSDAHRELRKTEDHMNKNTLISMNILMLVGPMAMALQVGAHQSGRGPMNEKFRAAFEACLEETGVSKPEQGQPPSEVDRLKVDSCLRSKGISLPQRQGPPPKGERPPPPPHPNESSSDDTEDGSDDAS
jgi:hypothetical protein